VGKSGKEDASSHLRVRFEHGLHARMMAIDGTWQRECILNDVAETEATLSVGSSIEGLQLKEFFLLLSSTGVAYRRCSLAWINGDQIGVRFVRPGKKSRGLSRSPDDTIP
jgi:hypothetical protein